MYRIEVVVAGLRCPANVAMACNSRPAWARSASTEVTQRVRAEAHARGGTERSALHGLDQVQGSAVRHGEDARRLATIPGIGVLNATALVAAIGNGETFARGRDLAAWLGLMPRQITTGGKPRLVGITKRGNKYLRKLLIHGARSVLPTLATSATPLGDWLRALMQRVHKNAAVVALANKLARIVWMVLRPETTAR